YTAIPEGSNPFFFVNEAGQGYVMGSSNGSSSSVASPTSSGILPPNFEFDNDRRAESDHNCRLFVALADGPVAWVSNSVNTLVWFASFTRNGGEALQPDF